MKKNNLALFDLDGTLFYTIKVNFKAYQKALEDHGYTITYDDFTSQCNSKHYLDFLPQFSTHDMATLKSIHKLKKSLYKSFLGEARINQHLFKLLQALKNDHYVGLVTNASSENTQEILEYFQKKEAFDLILTQKDVSKPKPDPEGFLKAMDYFNISPENTVIFEDADVGIEAARQTGATVLVINQF